MVACVVRLAHPLLQRVCAKKYIQQTIEMHINATLTQSCISAHPRWWMRRGYSARDALWYRSNLLTSIDSVGYSALVSRSAVAVANRTALAYRCYRCHDCRRRYCHRHRYCCFYRCWLASSHSFVVVFPVRCCCYRCCHTDVSRKPPAMTTTNDCDEVRRVTVDEVSPPLYRLERLCSSSIVNSTE